MDDLADLTDSFLEYTVGRRIGHHQGAEPVGMGVRLGSQIRQVYVALLIACDDDHGQARQRRRSRVGAVSGGGKSDRRPAGPATGVS